MPGKFCFVKAIMLIAFLLFFPAALPFQNPLATLISGLRKRPLRAFGNSDA